MINNEYKNSSEVYKVQTFRTTHIAHAEAFAPAFAERVSDCDMLRLSG